MKRISQIVLVIATAMLSLTSVLPAQTVPTSPSYIKIKAPAADSNRPIYLDGCYIGTIASIDSIGMFTGPHIASFFSDLEKEYYIAEYNYFSVPHVNTSCLGLNKSTWFEKSYVGWGSKIIVAGSRGAFMQPGQTQIFAMDYGKVEALIEEAKVAKAKAETEIIEHGSASAGWWVIPVSLAAIAIGAIVIVSSSGE